MRFPMTAFLIITLALITNAQQSPVDLEGHIVDFARDIAPIFRQNCLECHGPDEPKGDFRIDEAETVLDYLEAGDLQESSLYMDYLINPDEDFLMPPPTHGGPLKPQELALIRVWIQEGASWPDDFQLDSDSAVKEVAPPATQTPSLLSRAWAAQGFLHPATVHFPIALLTLGAGFVVLGWKWPSIGTQIPLACLLIGAVGSIAATAMGWSFAPERGYGGWNRFDAAMMDKEVFWHRWTGVVVTVLSVAFAIVALIAIKKDSKKLNVIWKLGLIICAGIVGAVGHQGGEMSYGKDLYPKMFRTLLGQPAEQATPTNEQPTNEPLGDEQAVEPNDEHTE